MRGGGGARREQGSGSILQPYFGQQRVWLQVNMNGLLSEFRKFPLSEVKDELDAMAYAADNYWSTRPGVRTDQKVYIEAYEESRKTANKSTGY